MRYLGSKTLLLENIFQIVSEYKSSGYFCDPFGGIGTVGSYMKSKGYSVISGDILKFAHFFQVAKIQNNSLPKFNNVIGSNCNKNAEDLEFYFNKLKVNSGWFIDEYSIKRNFFTVENATRIQACINQIWSWHQEMKINETEYAVLIASLIDSMDKVANTAGTYYAYLKSWYRKSLKSFSFQIIKPTYGDETCRTVLIDADNLIRSVKTDILYLDPPYNERNYGRYYHLPETIARGQIPNPKGKSGVHSYPETLSSFNNKKKSIDAFEKIIISSDAKCIIFHYTDEGLIPCEKIRELFSSIGKLNEYYFDSKGYTTKSRTEKKQHHIFRVIR